MNKLLKKVFVRIKPTSRELHEMDLVYNEIKTRMKNVLSRGTEIKLVGSAAKGTSLGRKKEMDVFVLLSKEHTKEEMERLMKEIGQCFDEWEMRKTEHPYVRVKIKRYVVDIAPAHKLDRIDKKIISSFDRTQLHTDYINGHMKKKQKEEVLLLKKFLEVNGLYGAQIKIQGFSGYLCELLILIYGDFMNVLKKASEWKMPLLDPANHYEMSFWEVLRKQFPTPLIVIDPVDKTRNVAANLSENCYTTFVLLAREFLRKPSPSFFFKKRKQVVPGRIYSLTLKTPNVAEEIRWGQLRKISSSWKKFLERNQFDVVNVWIDEDKKYSCIFFSVVDDKLSERCVKLGPPIEMKNDAAEFLRCYKNIFIKNNRLCSVEKRKIRTIMDAWRVFKKTPPPSHCSFKDVTVRKCK